MEPPEGFEPPTLRIEAACSFPLNYGGEKGRMEAELSPLPRLTSYHPSPSIQFAT